MLLMNYNYPFDDVYKMLALVNPSKLTNIKDFASETIQLFRKAAVFKILTCVIRINNKK